MMNQRTIAIVDDEPAQRGLLQNALERAGYRTVLCENGEAALEQAGRVDLMLLDVRMPGIGGLEVFERLHETHPGLPVIFLTAYIDVRDAVRAVKMGAVDYLEKPVDLDELIAAVDDTLGFQGRHVSGEVALPKGVVAESEGMRQLFQQAARVAESEATVLILGESGAGKEVVARFIHERSARRHAPLVAVDCTSLPENLAESELFGHEKGAFTGADASYPGRFEQAEGGTVFLDEIGELPVALQPKLLRVLENGVYRRVGGREERRTDVRVLAATNRNLEEEVRKGAFREDLFYRLNVFPIEVPALRDRADDILPLADRFLEPHHKKLAPAAQRLLAAYRWPGNVRELRNAMERAAILANGNLVLPKDLPAAMQTSAEEMADAEAPVASNDMKEIQRRAILDALEACGGNKTKAAERLGISRRNLIYKLRAYGM